MKPSRVCTLRHVLVVHSVGGVQEGGHDALEVSLQAAHQVVEGHLHSLRQQLLGVGPVGLHLHVLLEEVQHFRGVGHPEGQGCGVVVVFLQNTQLTLQAQGQCGVDMAQQISLFWDNRYM